MDRMYRWTRHVYDLTRRYYLLGRNRLLRQIARRSGGHVLEIGCGTARNLCLLHEKALQHTLYGLDASRAMLSTARKSTGQAGCATAVTLGQGLAESLDPPSQLGVDRTFDVIFFSYVLSMIPSWAEALEAALTHLRPGGQLYIVDFWDQAELPLGTGTLLQGWLSLFGAKPRPKLISTIRWLDTQRGLSSAVVPVARRYGYIATVTLQKRPDRPFFFPACCTSAS